MKKKVHVILLLTGLLMTIVAFRAGHVLAEQVQVRLFSHLKISVLQIYSPVAGYRLMGDGNAVTQILAGINYRFSLEGDKIQVMENQRVIGNYRYLKFVGNGTSELKVRLLQPDKKLRTYADNLSLGVLDSGIRIINEVQLDNYIAGVTDAEAGTRCALEFYKVQAILARTFALAHINKHVSEGFSLCDLVHCQAYHGKPRDLNVTKAVEATRGLVVVDQNLDLIVAAFHSNSGGQTANSEDVWGGHTSYLRSVTDTFSTKMPNFLWERRMLADDWLSYLKLKHNFPVETDSGRNIALTFKQENRKSYLECSTAKVPLKNVRQDLQLRSTFFSVSRLGKDSVLFSGRGYGHGLGMCQEGAMLMAKRGYSYQDILNYYYQNIQLIDLEKLRFFRDE
jgi:stage II sporulation protein D